MLWLAVKRKVFRAAMSAGAVLLVILFIGSTRLTLHIFNFNLKEYAILKREHG